ncbi:hypothetical protein V3C99_018226 [Haemonchus contortus]|uniref:Uncharacterized protein n=1 Tax=Haemonchus contortus TaxID=6289 RepID=A0A7I4Z5K2_HAECO
MHYSQIIATVGRSTSEKRHRLLVAPPSHISRTKDVPLRRLQEGCTLTKERLEELWPSTGSLDTIYRFQNQGDQVLSMFLGFGSYRLFRGQMLSEEAKKNRLEKCQKLLAAVRASRLSDTVWTDEEIFTVEVAHNS